MNGRARVVSIFADSRGFAGALERLKEAGQRDVTAYSPVGMLGLERLLPRRGSPIRFIALVAGICGCIGGFWMCIGSAELYNLIVGGKHPVNLLPYAIIGFELAILTAGVITLGAIIGFAKLRPAHPVRAYDPRFAVDEFGIVVQCPESEIPSVVALLRAAGAKEVHEQREPDDR